MAFDLGSLLQQYVGGAAPTANVQEHFDQVAQNAPPEAVSDGLAAAFHSDSTPPFGQMVGQLFGAGDPILGRADRPLQEHVPGAQGQPHARVDGSHFVQEDAGQEIARRTIDWVHAT